MHARDQLEHANDPPSKSNVKDVSSKVSKAKQRKADMHAAAESSGPSEIVQKNLPALSSGHLVAMASAPAVTDVVADGSSSVRSDSTGNEDETHSCASCLGNLRRNSIHIKCQVCFGFFHFTCTGVSEHARRPFMETVKHVGWVYSDCKAAARSVLICYKLKFPF
jgi:hypothetical protein